MHNIRMQDRVFVYMCVFTYTIYYFFAIFSRYKKKMKRESASAGQQCNFGKDNYFAEGEREREFCFTSYYFRDVFSYLLFIFQQTVTFHQQTHRVSSFFPSCSYVNPRESSFAVEMLIFNLDSDKPQNFTSQ